VPGNPRLRVWGQAQLLLLFFFFFFFFFFGAARPAVCAGARRRALTFAFGATSSFLRCAG
jgi:hypothetical protein